MQLAEMATGFVGAMAGLTEALACAERTTNADPTAEAPRLDDAAAARVASIKAVAAAQGEGVEGIARRSMEEGRQLAAEAVQVATRTAAAVQAERHQLELERAAVRAASQKAKVDLGLVRELIGAASLPFGEALAVAVREEVAAAMDSERHSNELRWTAASHVRSASRSPADIGVQWSDSRCWMQAARADRQEIYLSEERRRAAVCIQRRTRGWRARCDTH